MEWFDFKYLVAPVAAWVIAHIVKAVIGITKNGRFSIRQFFGSGGMPSAHTAVLAALTTLIGLSDNITSPIFALAAVMLFVVAYDAFHARRAVGEQGRAIDGLLPKNAERPYFSRGHTLIEVICGAAVGVIIGAATYYIM